MIQIVRLVELAESLVRSKLPPQIARLVELAESARSTATNEGTATRDTATEVGTASTEAVVAVGEASATASAGAASASSVRSAEVRTLLVVNLTSVASNVVRASTIAALGSIITEAAVVAVGTARIERRSTTTRSASTVETAHDYNYGL